MSASIHTTSSFNPPEDAGAPGPRSRTRHSTRRALAVAVTALVAASACSGAGTTSPGISGGSEATGEESPSADGGATENPVEDVAVIEPGDDVVLTSGLARFNDCGALLGYLRDEYSERVGPWGFDDGLLPIALAEELVFDTIAVDEAADMAQADEAPSGATAAPAPVEGVDFSGTNVQEQGVDEADIIKTDGNRIFALSAGWLVVVDAAARRKLGSVKLADADGQSAEMLISGDSVLIVQTSNDEATLRPTVVLQRVDVSQDASPQVVQTLHVEGEYLSARSVSGTARVVMRHDPQWDFPFVYPQNSASEERARQSNAQAIRESTLDDWLPNYSSDAAGLSEGSLLGDCANVHAPSEFAGFGITAVMSVPINDVIDGSSATMVTAPGDTVYASQQSLYVATTRWADSEASEDGSDAEPAAWDHSTSLHRFDITGAAAAVYEASGDVDGYIHNQFSLSEHAGHLRVVTTTGGGWSEDSESQVRVLRQDGSRLIEVGSVGDIGRGEDVHSVRFVGDVGYVVTFRQIDPFYTIDLSDPANPAVLGELKIPGFSSYLHPISDTMVLGVGSDADSEGRVTGAKVSLFDVSDLSAPAEVAVWTAPGGWNDIGWDHRGFLWWAPRNMAVIPVSVHPSPQRAELWSGAVVLHVADGAITELGRVDHADESDFGRTECRLITEDDLPPGADSDADFESSSYVEYVVRRSDSAVIACSPDQRVAIEGYNCYGETLTSDLAELGVPLEPGEEADVCWFGDVPAMDEVVRSLVIGDELWTLGYPGNYWYYHYRRQAASLQASDLETLQPLAALDL